MGNSILVYSFHTPDEYYAGKAQLLKRALDTLDVDYKVDEVEIPEGKEWPDICRQKIEKIYSICNENPNKKVFWIDVDCLLKNFPEHIKNFSADIVGFQRGFSNPMRMGYHLKSRFWEPCFFGINNTSGGRRFIEDAYIFERRFEGKATDDYFFEESWRRNCKDLSFQIIPSSAAATMNRKPSDKAFFHFGASGNVNKFKGKVEQHVAVSQKGTMKGRVQKGDNIQRKMAKLKFRIKAYVASKLPASVKLFIKKVLLGQEEPSVNAFKKQAKKLPLKAFRITLISAAKNGNGKLIDDIINRFGGIEALNPKRKVVAKQAKALASYSKNASAVNEPQSVIELSWWINPAPGNFGDWLSPYIFSKLSGQPVRYVNPQSKSIDIPHFFGVGSIAKFAKDTSIVLGSGFSSKEAIANPKAKYLMVRGPLSRDIVISCGGQCPEVYGDPGIIMPRLYSPKIGKNNDRYALIRHFKHKDLPLLLTDNIDELDIFASSPEEIEHFIDSIHSYKGIVTTAMHGYIICQAYGLPCALATFEGAEDLVHGDGMKYSDYFLGIEKAPKNTVVLPRNLGTFDFESVLESTPIDSEVIDRVYNTMKNAVKSLR